MTQHIGKKGRIICGEYAGYSIRIDNDTANTGGFLILVWNENSDDGFDNWVATEKDIEQFFYESDWKIEWSA